MNYLIRILFERVSTSREYNNSPEYDAARVRADKCDDELKRLLGKLYNFDVEELIVKQISEYEKCAFRIGFKTAMRLVSECCNFSLPKGGVENE